MQALGHVNSWVCSKAREDLAHLRYWSFFFCFVGFFSPPGM